jgi:hypothetical protein
MVVAACDARAENSLFRQVTAQGIRVGSQANVPLPPPAIVDDMPAAEQWATLERLSGSVPRDEFVRPSVVAPHVLKMESVTAGGQREAQRISLFFVAFGRVHTVRDEKLLREFTGAATGKARTSPATAESLTAQTLAERSLTERHEEGLDQWFVRFETGLLDRVQVSGVLNVVQSVTPESVLVCTVLDERFADDRAYPNRWRHMELDSTTGIKLGTVQPYAGFAAYVKATALSKVPGALLIEAHSIFNEPVEWFGGANLLRSKLPLAVQDQVRSFRRKLANAERGAAR